MAKYELEILGDNSKFTKVVSQSMRQLDELSAHTGGFFDGISSKASKATGALNALTGMTPGLQALGVAGAGVGLAMAAISKTSDYVNGLNQISTNTGVSVEMLQKLQNQFRATGLEAEKFGDMNKDALDKLGDSFRNGGGGVADDLKEWGIGLESLTKYAGDAQGGIKAIIDVFYQMKAAGRSQAEITNVMETMASDSSHMITTLDQFTSSTEALIAIQGQNASITNQTAAEYKEFKSNLDTLGTNLQGLAVNVIAPLVKEINGLWGVFNKKWTETEFTSMLSHFFYDGDTAIAKGLRKLSDVPDEGYSNASQAATERLKGMMADLKSDVDISVKEAHATSETNKKIAQKNAEDAKKASDKAQAERDRAAAKAKASQDKIIAERTAAMNTLNSLNNQMYSGQGQSLSSQAQQLQASVGTLKNMLDKGYITQEQYVQKRQALIQASQGQFKAMLLGASPEQLTESITAVQQIYDNQSADLKARLDKRMIDQKTYNDQMLALEQNHQAQMDALKGVNGQLQNAQNITDLGFGTDQDQMLIQQAALDKQKEQFDANNQAMAQAGIITHQQYLDQKARLDQAYSLKSQQISMTEVQTKLGLYNSMAGSMSNIVSGLAGQNSKAAKAAFAVSKGTAIAEGMLNAYQSASKAMATYPGPVGYAMAASSYAQVLGQVMSMKSVNLTGMAHDGIDNVPSEGTWLLNKGERVVDDRTNGDLKQFLNKQDKQSEAPITVHAPLTIQGSVSNRDTEVLEAIKKHPSAVALMVQDANRRRM
ncbi:hypothetical protein [Pantoea sp. MBLJ3]|uniref:hypothetical protein n=1 Tax=Pantoea sp. MBLJ3 TaxID=1562889 RepID=UPI00057F24C5|nr:hypothetical protein [Pantoea sp. MBLJ3]